MKTIKKINLPVLTDFPQSLRDRVFSMEYLELCEIGAQILSNPENDNSLILACCAELIARRHAEETDLSKYKIRGDYEVL